MINTRINFGKNLSTLSCTKLIITTVRSYLINKKQNKQKNIVKKLSKENHKHFLTDEKGTPQNQRKEII